MHSLRATTFRCIQAFMMLISPSKFSRSFGVNFPRETALMATGSRVFCNHPNCISKVYRNGMRLGSHEYILCRRLQSFPFRSRLPRYTVQPYPWDRWLPLTTILPFYRLGPDLSPCRGHFGQYTVAPAPLQWLPKNLMIVLSNRVKRRA